MRYYKLIIILISINLLFSSCGIFNRSAVKVVSDKDKKAEKNELNYKHFFFEANKLKMLGNYKEATAYFLHCLELKPGSGAPAYELAGLAVANKDLQSAVKFAEIAYKSDPKNKWYLIMLADITKRQGNLNRTISLLNELVKQYPNVPEYYMEIASTYMIMNKTKEAIKIFDDIEERFGVSEEISFQKEQIFESKGDFINSRKELEKLIKANPQEPRYYGLLAESYMSTGQMDKAKEIYDKLLKIDPQNGIAFISISEYYRLKNNKSKSDYYIRKAFASDDIDINSKIQILVNNYANSQNKKIDSIAFDLLDTLVKNNPNKPEVYAVYSDFLIQNKEYKKSAYYLKQVLNIDKKNGRVWEQLFLIQGQINRLDSMYYYSKEAIDLFPTYAKFYMYNAAASYSLKRFSESIKVSEEGLKYVVDNDFLKVKFYSFMAQSYNAIKEYANSDLYFEKILEIDPDNDQALNNYSYFLSLRKEKLDKALKMSTKLYERNPLNYTYIDTYGWVLYVKGSYNKAENILAEAVNKGGDKNPVILEHYGDALFKNNKIDKAVEVWKAARDIADNTVLLDKKIKEKKLMP
jgi:tetratricopeptide (TPR) repeat protein